MFSHPMILVIRGSLKLMNSMNVISLLVDLVGVLTAEDQLTFTVKITGCLYVPISVSDLMRSFLIGRKDYSRTLKSGTGNLLIVLY